MPPDTMYRIREELNRGRVQSKDPLRPGFAPRALRASFQVLKYVAVAIAFFSLLLVIWLVPYWQAQWYGKATPDVVNEFRGTLSQIIGGLALLYGLYLTARRIAATEKQASAATQNVQLIEAGQVDERFSRAVAQLGSSPDQLHIRMGGIYVLKTIAKDHPLLYEIAILNILTVFVRKRSTEIRSVTESESFDPTEDSIPQDDDLSAAVEVASGIVRFGNRIGELKKIDLRGAILRSSDFESADLRFADLVGTDLREANFRHAKLSGANLYGADMRGACLHDVDLNDADLRKADLRGTDFTCARMDHTKLEGAVVSEAKLEGEIMMAAVRVKSLPEYAEMSFEVIREQLRGDPIFCQEFVNDKNGANFIQARNLTCEQLRSTNSWEGSIRGQDLACDAPIPAIPDGHAGTEDSERNVS